MRDVIILMMILGIIPFILRSAVLGVYVWVWLSMMSPHQAGYGFIRTLPLAQVVVVATFVGLFFGREWRSVPRTTLVAIMSCLLAWMSITSLFAFADQDRVTDRWIFVMKTFVMVFVTIGLIRGRQQIDKLIWVLVVSIGIYGVKGGIWTVLTGGSGRVWGPAGLLEGNNELAVALVMMVPLMVYLLQTNGSKWIRWLLIFSIVTTCFAILGTQSRGALLSLVVMSLFVALKGKRPFASSALIVSMLAVVIAFMPASWTQRMDTIQTYEGDSSAMSRIYTWRTLSNCALDRPLVGAGFGADNIVVFSRYAPVAPEYAAFEGLVLVAHSIYFQMLGEHGFPGLMFFIGIGLTAWIRATRLSRMTKDDPEFGAWVPLLMPMIQVSLIGFAIGGAFLSLAYLDVPYYVVALVVVVDATLSDRNKKVLSLGPTNAQLVS